MDMWDLARYVEDHPGDYEQRWRLAKKLYMAWEYRLTLEHLQVLKNEWHRKVNVVRYLAATYYRLGRYEEAVAELRAAIQVWPDELSLREQLARVYEVWGKRTEAAATWDSILRRDPKHPIASDAATRLRVSDEETPTGDADLMSSDTGIDLSPGQVCPSCGAQNSFEFDRCWQCQASLVSGRTTPPPLPHAPRALPSAPNWGTLTLVLTLTAVLFIAISGSLFIQHMSAWYGTPGTRGIVFHTVREFLSGHLVLTRIVVAMVLLITWPAALTLVLAQLRHNWVPPGIAIAAGLLMASLSAAASWLPGLFGLAGLFFPLLLMLFLMLSMFRMPVRQALVAWLAHAVIVIVAGACAFMVRETYVPFIEAPAIIAYGDAHDRQEDPGVYPVPGFALPARMPLEWESSGSTWLDGEANNVLIRLDNAGNRDDLIVELREVGAARETTVGYYHNNLPEAEMTVDVAPGVTYELRVSGPPGARPTLTIHGLLRPRFERTAGSR